MIVPGRAGWLATAAAALVAGAPGLAQACPACAGREGPGLGSLLVVGAMIGVPYAVATVAIQVIRRLDRDPGATDAPDGSARGKQP